MTRRLFTWLGVALLSGVVVAGCGSSGSSSSNQATPATTTTSTTPGGTATSSAGGTSTSGAATSYAGGASPGASGVSSATLQQAAATCKQSIQSQSTLSASLKVKLEGICDKLATGNPAAARSATQQVCEEIIKSSGQLTGAAEQQSLAACKTK